MPTDSTRLPIRIAGERTGCRGADERVRAALSKRVRAQLAAPLGVVSWARTLFEGSPNRITSPDTPSEQTLQSGFRAL
jgi:hypothetical protein